MVGAKQMMEHENMEQGRMQLILTFYSVNRDCSTQAQASQPVVRTPGRGLVDSPTVLIFAPRAKVTFLPEHE